MKTRTHPNQIIRRALVLTALLAGVFLAPTVRAQPAVPKTDNRFLFIFDTSSDMKARLPAVQKALDGLLTNSVNGPFHAGDSIGVWTFDQELHLGQFPLQYWMPGKSPIIVSNLIRFLSKQHYSKRTRLDALQPLLNHVVQGSLRLTVLIFCDGKGEIHGTPYDPGINQLFLQRQAERQKMQLPIVIGLRSQFGQCVGCTVSFPPLPVNLPEFPPLPEAAQAPPAETPPPTSPLPSNIPPLIIVGTTITNQAPPLISQLAPEPVNPPPVTDLQLTTNPPSITATSTPAPATTKEILPPEGVPSAPASPVPAPANVSAEPVMPVKTAASLPETSPDIDRKSALTFGVVFGVAFLAGGLVVFMFRRIR